MKSTLAFHFTHYHILSDKRLAEWVNSKIPTMINLIPRTSNVLVLQFQPIEQWNARWLPMQNDVECIIRTLEAQQKSYGLQLHIVNNGKLNSSSSPSDRSTCFESMTKRSLLHINRLVVPSTNRIKRQKIFHLNLCTKIQRICALKAKKLNQPPGF